MDNTSILEKFKKELESKDRSPSTIIAYTKDVEQLTTFLSTREKDLQSANTKDLEEYIQNLIDIKKYTLKTVSRKINTLKTFYSFLLANNFVKKDFAEPIKHPEFKNKPPRVLSAVEYKALRDTVRSNLRLYSMVELMLQTGIRIGEISRLKDTDVKLESNPPSIRISPFASNPERFVELNDIAITSLKSWMNNRPQYTKDSEFVFSTKTGKPVLVRNIRTSINRAFKKISIDDATVNDIRNTFIVFQLSKGLNTEKIAETVGHQRITSTEKYLELIDKVPSTKINKLQEL